MNHPRPTETRAHLRRVLPIAPVDDRLAIARRLDHHPRAFATARPEPQRFRQLVDARLHQQCVARLQLLHGMIQRRERPGLAPFARTGISRARRDIKIPRFRDGQQNQKCQARRDQAATNRQGGVCLEHKLKIAASSHHRTGSGRKSQSSVIFSASASFNSSSISAYVGSPATLFISAGSFSRS